MIWNWQAISLGIAVTLMVLLQWLVFRTRFGCAMRAVSFDHRIAALMGIPVDRIIAGTFMLTCLRHLMRRGSLVAQIEAVRIDAPLRGRGLGAEMMRWAIDEARRRGCSHMQLTSNLVRKDAHRFYERLGFRGSHLGMKLLLT